MTGQFEKVDSKKVGKKVTTFDVIKKVAGDDKPDYVAGHNMSDKAADALVIKLNKSKE